MIKNNLTAQGYKSPVCKVVRVHFEGALMGASDTVYTEGGAGSYDEVSTTDNGGY